MSMNRSDTRTQRNENMLTTIPSAFAGLFRLIISREEFVGSLVGAWTCSEFPLSIREASIELNLITCAPGKAFRLPNCSSAPSERRSRGPLNHRNDGPNRVFPTTFCCCPWGYPCFLETKHSHPTANSGTPSSWQVLIKVSKSVTHPEPGSKVGIFTRIFM